MILIDSLAIRDIMIKRQLGIKELANMTKIPTSTISHIAKADKKVTFKTAGKLIKALEIEPETIIKSV